MPAGHTNQPLQRRHQGLPRAWSWTGRERSPVDRYQLLALEGYTLLKTDRNWWIELEEDGERLYMEVEKK